MLDSGLPGCWITMTLPEQTDTCRSCGGARCRVAELSSARQAVQTGRVKRNERGRETDEHEVCVGMTLDSPVPYLQSTQTLVLKGLTIRWLPLNNPRAFSAVFLLITRHPAIEVFLAGVCVCAVPCLCVRVWCVFGMLVWSVMVDSRAKARRRPRATRALAHSARRGHETNDTQICGSLGSFRGSFAVVP